MPIYAYKCDTCEHRFEVRQRFSDDPLTECPRCEGEIRRVITQVGLVFKGSGFYVTDNRNGKSNGKMNGAAKSKSETESDSKPKSDKSAGSGAVGEKKESGSAAAGTAA
jgi:putative FmdB family regulatory protein